MRDYVLVNFGEEQEFVVKAKELGFEELVLVFNTKDVKFLSKDLLECYQSEGFRVYFGVILEQSLDVPIFVEEKIGLGTKICSLWNGLTAIYYNEFLEEKDGLHERRAGLNHVSMVECRQKGVDVLFGYADLFNEVKRSQKLGRAMQNKKLCVKKAVAWRLCSMAKNPEDMRNAKDVGALRELL